VRFEHAAYQNEGEAMKAIADVVSITRSPTADRLTAWHEQISINLRAVRSFDAFAHAFEALNPFTFWAKAARLAWFPWLEAIRAVTLPPSGARPDLRWLA